MYMHRTQIYLRDDDVVALDAESARTGASRAELIRRAIRLQYGEPSQWDKLEVLHATTKIRPDQPETGADYVEHIRAGAHEQMSRLKSR